MTDDNTNISDRRALVEDRFTAQGLGSVSAWLDAQRVAGQSWAHMSWALRDLVGMDVSYETLRRWWAADRTAERNRRDLERRRRPAAGTGEDVPAVYDNDLGDPDADAG